MDGPGVAACRGTDKVAEDDLLSRHGFGSAILLDPDPDHQGFLQVLPNGLFRLGPALGVADAAKPEARRNGRTSVADVVIIAGSGSFGRLGPAHLRSPSVGVTATFSQRATQSPSLSPLATAG